MKFLLDVNASGSLAHWLLSQGHEVILVQDVDPRMGDEEVLDWAFREKRIIVTTDQDFNERLSLFQFVLNHYGQDLVSGAVIIASRQKIRIRRPVTDV